MFMSSVRTFWPLRLLISAWLITWIASVPLYHFHIPDTTDRWSTLQSGGAHTVFTPDLPGEFFHPFRDSQHRHSSHLSHRMVNSPEFGIVLLDDSTKAKQLNIFSTPHQSPENPLLLSLVFTFPEGHRNLRLFQSFLGSRAPPPAMFFS